MKKPGANLASPSKPAGKAKAKSKAKAKAKSKTKSGSSLKRPASAKGKATPKKKAKTCEPPSELEEKKEADPKKHGSKNKPVPSSSWAQGSKEGCVVGDPEEGEEEKPESDPMLETADPFECKDPKEGAARKDRSKDNKFRKLLSQGSLPPWLEKAWNDTLKLKTGRPAAQRKIVNEPLTRSPDGSLQVTLDKATFHEFKDLYLSKVLPLSSPDTSNVHYANSKETFKKETSKAKQKSLSKTLFMGKFHLSQDAFEAGLAAGEFFQVVSEDGRVTYAWEQDEHSTVKGTSSSHQASGEKKLTQQEFELEKIAMAQWKFGLFKRNQPLPLTNERALAIEDLKVELSDRAWEMAQKQLNDAQNAMDKLMKDGKKHLQTIGVDNKDDPLKDIVKTVGNVKAKLDHVYNWKETPDGEVLTLQAYDDCMAQAGVVAERSSEQLAGVQGQLKARAKK
eukprot:Skav200441  [mRNA]  locus=scaffold559:18580:20348:- [translate_table: standard]